MAEIIVLPEIVGRIREKTKEQQLEIGMSAESEARRQIEDSRDLVLNELCSLEAELESTRQALHAKQSEMDAWKTKAHEWSALVKRRRVHYRRERRTNRVLISLVITFLIATIALAAIVTVFVLPAIVEVVGTPPK